MLRVGIAGIGFMGMIHYLAYQRLSGVKVVAMCEKDETRLNGDWRSIKGNFGPPGQLMDLTDIAKYTELSQFVKDPNVDLVDICLPPWLHCETAIMALEAGKHVFCEKPIALRVEDAERMVETAQRVGKQLLVGQVLPFFEAFQFALDAARSGRFGRVLGANLVRVISDPLWLADFWDPQRCGGPLVDLHIHDTHFIRLLFGMPKQVRSVGRCRGEVVEFCNTQYLFDDPNLVVTATSGVINQQGRPFTHGYEIHFEKATIVHESWMGMPPTVLTEDGKVEKPQLPGGDEVDAFARELQEVISCVQEGRSSEILDGTLARDALKLVFREDQAVKTRETIDV